MLERLQKLLHSMSGHDRGPSRFTRDDPRVAAAALFFHVVDADGVVSKSERRKLKDIIASAYKLKGAELEAVLKAGELADDEAVDLYAFTSVLKRSLDSDQRVDFVELLWEVVYADGERHELEENVVWRIAELLGVSARQRVWARQRVEDGRGE
ncbi:TerB family tellurite resistance protein [Pararhizobium haloflavum]|uniref:tellurite resistance TerB family protein n=1 Tax=Pararhizobium haloflavum TaxID=2037914 RepID=UPI000C17F31C|nr:TerB family tellurite resistance protein [Pararhizobium haloflavum]